jgi:hypothetical protein
MPSIQDKGLIRFKVVKAKSQKTNPATAAQKDQFEARQSVNTMDSSFQDIDIENIRDPQMQVVFQGMAQSTK